MQPLPYAPYPLSGVRDWFYRWRHGVRVAVVVLLGVTLGPAGYRLWNMPDPAFKFGFGPGGIGNAGLNIPAPEVDCSKSILAAIGSLPTEPSAGPLATPVPAGMKWISWSEYELAQGVPPDRASQSGRPPGLTFDFDPTEALSGPWMETRFHLSQIVNYLELPATRAALQTVCDLSDRPQCLTNTAVNPAGFRSYAAIRETVKLLAARAHYRLIRQHDYPAAAEDLEAIWQLSAGMEDDGVSLPVLVGMACRGLAISEATNWAHQGLLTAEQAKNLMARLDRHRFQGEKAIQRAMDGEYECCMSYFDALFAPGEHGRQVLCLQASVAGNWLVRSLNLLSPLTYDRQEARRWTQAIWDLNRMVTFPPVEREKVDRLNKLVRTDPLFSQASIFGVSGFARVPTINARTEGEEEAARTALALVMFKAKRGQYPARLEELVPDYLPALAVDPFSGQPLCYRVERDGRFTLYSVDEDGQDNGGASSGYPKDQVFTRDHWPQEEWVLVPVEGASRPTGD